MKYAREYFRKYKNADVLYFTSDDLAFPDKKVAQAHAYHLDDDTVMELGRHETNMAMKDMVGEGWLSGDDMYSCDAA